ncbi:MAG: zf-HC2 domain-containing protein [Saccharofermentans sp.]|nr:zf-HC2 domain-containing protein [Saccharofermentans sp.]
MKFDCDIISDLLPMYKDGICSDTSRKIVEEHLAECPSCSKVLNMMNDTAIDEEIIKEKNEVIQSQAKFFKRKSAVAGFIIALVLLVPVLICFIVDIAAGSGLSWFFIVFAAMLIPASLFVTPFMMPKYKMFTTMSAFTVSVILLLGVCCIYSRGSWFFVAASAALFGLTICFAPFIACRRPVNAYLKNRKGLAIMGAYTLTFVLMMFCIGLTAGGPGFFPVAFAVSAPIIAAAWIVFAVIRYVPLNGLIKAGICTALISILTYVSPSISNSIAVKASATGVVSYTTPTPVFMILGLSVAAVLAVIGIIIGIAKGGNKNAKA